MIFILLLAYNEEKAIQHLLEEIDRELQKQKVIGVRAVFLDSTIVRAHQSASGARKKRGSNPSADRAED